MQLRSSMIVNRSKDSESSSEDYIESESSSEDYTESDSSSEDYTDTESSSEEFQTPTRRQLLSAIGTHRSKRRGDSTCDESIDNIDGIEDVLNPDEIKILKELDSFIGEHEPSVVTVCRTNTSFEKRLQLYRDVIRYNDCQTDTERLDCLLEFKDNLEYSQKAHKLGMSVDINDCIIDFLEKSYAPDETKRIILSEYERVRTNKLVESDKQVFYGWWSWVKRLPVHFKIEKPIQTDLVSFLTSCSNILDESLYGLAKVKTRVLSILRFRFVYPERRTQPMGWIGEPGVGKTMLASLVSKCEGRSLERLILTDKNSLDGNNNVWVGASPGQPVMALCRSKTSSCCFLIDEVDKLDQSMLQSLLFLLDPDHNHAFVDNFVAHFPVDFSKVCFMLTSNSSTMHAALFDRVHWIRIPKYSYEERKSIIILHIIPRINKELNTDITITPAAISYLLQRECTIRWIKSAIKSIAMEKCLKLDMCGESRSMNIVDVDDVSEHIRAETEQTAVNHMYV